MMNDKHVADSIGLPGDRFNPFDWLGRWTDAGGGYVAGASGPYLLRPPCHCAALGTLSNEIGNPVRRQALASHLMGRQHRA